MESLARVVLGLASAVCAVTIGACVLWPGSSSGRSARRDGPHAEEAGSVSAYVSVP